MNWKQRRNLSRLEFNRKKLDELLRELPLPPLLTFLIESGRWVHPGDEAMLEKIPFIRYPLVFLESKEQMVGNSGPLMEHDECECDLFSEYRGSVIGERPLPWIDVEKSLSIICNRHPGDDIIIALDYRTGIETPRVVGCDWHSRDDGGSVFREISPSFDVFVGLIGL